MWEGIIRWYEGETKPHENDPESTLVFIATYQEYHWTAKIARQLVRWAKDFPLGKLYYLLASIGLIYAGFRWFSS